MKVRCRGNSLWRPVHKLVKVTEHWRNISSRSARKKMSLIAQGIKWAGCKCWTAIYCTRSDGSQSFKYFFYRQQAIFRSCCFPLFVFALGFWPHFKMEHQNLLRCRGMSHDPTLRHFLYKTYSDALMSHYFENRFGRIQSLSILDSIVLSPARDLHF